MMSEHSANAPDNASKTPGAGNEAGWAQDLIGRVAFASLLEQRRARRWGIFFKFLIFAYLSGLMVMAFLPSEWGLGKVMGAGHTALVNVQGLIASGSKASAENIIEGLRAAFEDNQTIGVIVEINSPGGSPVQAGEVYDEIMRLREKHPEIPVYAVASDVCASGGYYIAAATQAIYANKASIIGSIGVRADSFGFVEAMKKLGIERRLYTAGENKALLDPFAPTKPEDVRHLQDMLGSIHNQFIAAVKAGRGERLGKDPTLFSGLFWTGEKSLELGLIDGLASTRFVAEQIIGTEKVVDFTPRTRVFEQIFEALETAFTGALTRVLSLQGAR
jgi:protease-4